MRLPKEEREREEENISSVTILETSFLQRLGELSFLFSLCFTMCTFDTMGSLMYRIFHALIVGELNFFIVSTEILLCELCYDSLHFVLK